MIPKIGSCYAYWKWFMVVLGKRERIHQVWTWLAVSTSLQSTAQSRSGGYLYSAKTLETARSLWYIHIDPCLTKTSYVAGFFSLIFVSHMAGLWNASSKKYVLCIFVICFLHQITVFIPGVDSGHRGNKIWTASYWVICLNLILDHGKHGFTIHISIVQIQTSIWFYYLERIQKKCCVSICCTSWSFFHSIMEWLWKVYLIIMCIINPSMINSSQTRR